MKLLFVRHGQTEYNLKKIVQGQEVDAVLNDEGIRQVEAAAGKLPSDIDFIISSPLKRAAQTAEILNRKLNKEIIYNNDVMELRYGELAGKGWPEIVEIMGDPDAHQKDKDITFDYSPHNGDSADDLKRRVAKFVEDMKREYPDKTILIATHGGVIDSMHILFPQKEKPDSVNASIHEFEF